MKHENKTDQNQSNLKNKIFNKRINLSLSIFYDKSLRGNQPSPFEPFEPFEDYNHNAQRSYS